MTTYRHFDFTDYDQRTGGVRNIVSIGSNGEIVARDYQSAATNQIILDECAELRKLTANMPPGSTPSGESAGYIAAKIPITLWQNWRREWQEKYRNYFTWQTFEIMKLNSREYRGFKCVDRDIAVPEQVRTTGQ